jgi:regulator of replication initiation timing
VTYEDLYEQFTALKETVQRLCDTADGLSNLADKLILENTELRRQLKNSERELERTLRDKLIQLEVAYMTDITTAYDNYVRNRYSPPSNE